MIVVVQMRRQYHRDITVLLPQRDGRLRHLAGGQPVFGPVLIARRDGDRLHILFGPPPATDRVTFLIVPILTEYHPHVRARTHRADGHSGMPIS